MTTSREAVAGKVDRISKLNTCNPINKKTGETYEQDILNIYVLTEKSIFGVPIETKEQFVVYGETARRAAMQFKDMNPEALKALKDLKDKPNKYVYVDGIQKNKDKDGQYYKSETADSITELTKAQFSKISAGLKELMAKTEGEVAFE